MFTRGFCSFCLHLLTAITLFLPSLARVMALDVLRPPDWMPRDYGLAEASAPKTAFFAAASLSLLRGSLGQHAQGRSFRVRVLQMCRAIPHAELQTLAQPAHASKLLRPLWFLRGSTRTSSPCFRFFVRLHRRRGSAASATFPAPQEQMCCSELARLLICTPRKAGSRGGEGGDAWQQNGLLSVTQSHSHDKMT